MTGNPLDRKAETAGQPYGDLTRFNAFDGLLGAVGSQLLDELSRDHLELLESSSAVYERSGDYAMGIFTSGWCRFMDAASYRLAGTDDPEVALKSGRWHCHEACWTISKKAMERGTAVDEPCLGGIRIHAVPIESGGEVIGAINFGYGQPPRDDGALEVLADRYRVSKEDLRVLAEDHKAKPHEVVEAAKRRLGSTARLLGEIYRRHQVEQALREANAAREVLLQEVNHRVKNSLQAVTSLLVLQARRTADADARTALEEATRRVQVISGLHQRLYQTNDHDHVEFTAFAQQLAHGALSASESLQGLQLDFTADEEVVLPIGKAVPLALVLSELVTNATKYGAGLVRVCLSTDDGFLILRVSDEGPGLPPGFDPKAGHGFGMKIIRALVKQLQADMEVELSAPGAAFKVSVPLV